jgi:CubicO group peptidase (beta-lactamase class C family)
MPIRSLNRVLWVFASAALLSALAPARVHAQEEPTPAAAAERRVAARLEGVWEVRIERQFWQPRLVTGCLSVWDGPDGLVATMNIRQPGFHLPLPQTVVFNRVTKDRARMRVEWAEEHTLFELDLHGDGDVLVGTSHWPVVPVENCFASATRVAVARFDVAASEGDFPREADPSAVGLDPAALDRLILEASLADTDALLVVKDGRTVCHRTFGRPRDVCTLQSITKPIAALALPLLVEDGKLEHDWDASLTQWYPEWTDDPRRSRVTLRHLLTHTSGLESDGTEAMQAQDDYLAYALASAGVEEPGRRWSYSNQAFQLLTGIVAKAAGEPLDDYLARRLLRPLGVQSWHWGLDRAGNPPAYGGLTLEAMDLARIGQLVVQRGTWNDEQLVPAWWFDEIASPSPAWLEIGLSWFLWRLPQDERVVTTPDVLDRVVTRGVPQAKKLAPLVGQTFAGRRAWWLAAAKLLGETDTARLAELGLSYPSVAAEVHGPVTALYHTGSGGQHLVVYPDSNLVVVRQRRGYADDELDPATQERALLLPLEDLAYSLVPR